MEAPLIEKESTIPVLGGGTKGRESLTRSDAIAYGDCYQKAAALVDLAKDGTGIPEEVLNDAKFEQAAKHYFLCIKFNLLWFLNHIALVLLNFLEKPLWCWKSEHSCEDRDFFFLGELPYLGREEALIYENLYNLGSTILSCSGLVKEYQQLSIWYQALAGRHCSSILTVEIVAPTLQKCRQNVITFGLLVLQILAPISYEGLQLYWKSSMNKLKVGLLCILACDVVVYAALSSPLPFRLAPYIRVIFLMLTSRHFRTCTVTMAGLLQKYLSLLVLLLLFLLLASWLAYVAFKDTLQGKTTFTSYGTTLYQMFFLSMAFNNPDVWIPAYRESRWLSIFFVLYVLLGVCVLTNLVLAVIFANFSEQMAKQIAMMDSGRKSHLEKAFRLLDIHNRNYLDRSQCISLFEELKKNRNLLKTSRNDFELLFYELDRNGDFTVNLQEFSKLCGAIDLKFQKEPSPFFLETTYPAFYRSAPCEKLKRFVKGQYFEYGVVLMLVLNLIVVVIETMLDSAAQQFWQDVEIFFGWVYVLEMALKVFSLGFDAYWMEGSNKFDFIITWTIFILQTVTFAFPSQLSFLSNGEWIRYLLIGRILRLIRLLLLVQQLRAFVATFLKLIPRLTPYLGVIFFVLCFYCSLGLQLFGGIVNSGNSKLQDTDLYNYGYVLFNFNDYPNGMITLFNMLLGNWRAWMQSYTDLTGTYWTMAYFISFFLVTNMLLLRLIVAFVLSAFFAEKAIEKATEDSGKDTKMTQKRLERSTSLTDIVRHIYIDKLHPKH